jgi:hypothetical protein
MELSTLLKLIQENEAPRSYSCLMLDLSPLKKYWRQLERKICPCDLYVEGEGHGFETEPHITIKYGLHTNNFDEILDEIDFRPITLTMDKISLFENEEFDVLKFDIVSRALHGLNGRICDKFEFTDKFKDYHPHATIAYLKAGRGKDYVDMECPLLGEEVSSNRFTFSPADGEKSYYKA